jgi:ActR/RegA family two-component response regulator
VSPVLLGLHNFIRKNSTADMSSLRLLFVDDDESIRMTLPEILRRNGFEVRVAATVSEALAEINARPFDVLVSDLNIGDPGDGFTVVGAMRRTQPECTNFILTGYPAFESALEAIRNHVDDYIVKPANVDNLLQTIRDRVRTRGPRQNFLRKRVATVLRENAELILETVLQQLKTHPTVGRMPLSDAERLDYLPRFLHQMIDQLQSSHPQERSTALMETASEHGNIRRLQGYSASMLVVDIGLLDATIYETVEANLLDIDLSTLVMDLKWCNKIMQAQIMGSLEAFGQAETMQSA